MEMSKNRKMPLKFIQIPADGVDTAKEELNKPLRDETIVIMRAMLEHFRSTWFFARLSGLQRRQFGCLRIGLARNQSAAPALPF